MRTKKGKKKNRKEKKNENLPIKRKKKGFVKRT